MSAIGIKRIVKDLLFQYIPLKIFIDFQRRLLTRLTPILPQHIVLPFQNEINLALQQNSNQSVLKQYENAKDLLVNLGAGAGGKPGWVNVDVYQAPGINCVYDCRKSLPFPDNSVRLIFTEHFFEHIDYFEEVPLFLSECYRVLKKGGIIRIIVPDAEKYLQAYCQSGWSEISRLRQLDSLHTDFFLKCKYHTKMELINAVFRQGYEHKYAYDYETLELILYKYGFLKVQRQEFAKTLMDELCIDQQIRASESIYVEAVK